MLYSLLLVVCGSSGLALAGYSQRVLGTPLQPRTITHRLPITASSQALLRRGDDASRLSHSPPAHAQAPSRSGPIRYTQMNQSSGRPAMPRFPSPDHRDGSPSERDPHPRVALETKGPAAIATKAGRGGVGQKYYILPGPPHYATETHPEKAMAASVSHGSAPQAAESQPYAQHAVKAHAQGKSARLDIKVPLGGRGSFVHQNAEGVSGGGHIQGGKRMPVISNSRSPQGAHVYGSVTRGGRIVAQATNSNSDSLPSPQGSADIEAGWAPAPPPE